MTEKNFEINDAMVSAAVWAHQNAPTRVGHPFVPMRAAITAAIEASGLVDENARLREALVQIAKRDWYPVPSEIANEALNKEPTL